MNLVQHKVLFMAVELDVLSALHIVEVIAECGHGTDEGEFLRVLWLIQGARVHSGYLDFGKPLSTHPLRSLKSSQERAAEGDPDTRRWLSRTWRWLPVLLLLLHLFRLPIQPQFCFQSPYEILKLTIHDGGIIFGVLDKARPKSMMVEFFKRSWDFCLSHPFGLEAAFLVVFVDTHAAIIIGPIEDRW